MPEKTSAPNSYETVLQDLYAKRDEIENAINTILFLQGSPPSAQPTSAGNGGTRVTRAGVIPSNAFFGMSLVDAAKKYIELSQAKRTLAQIVAGLEEGGMPPQKPGTVYAALRRRESMAGDIMKVGEEWGLKDWFASISTGDGTKGRPPKAKSKKKSSKKRAKAASAARAETTTPAEPNESDHSSEAKTGKATKPDITVRNAAHAVLVKEDGPLHAEELAERINKEYGKNTNQKALAASLKDDATKRFDNIGHNTWVLHAWPPEKKKPKAAVAAA
jgi:HB1, ASXL, restriction endonuclease HTH domain